MDDLGPQKLSLILDNKQRTVKPPAYQWQDLALRVIKDLGIPRYKKNAVFKICRDNSKELVEKALNETKELAQKEKWKYFFKVVDNWTSE
jgi:hypothetical protein